jgi:hypothetical protein
MRSTAPLLAAVALAGCVTLTSERVVTGAARPPFAGDVKVVMEGAPVPGDVEELAIVTASGQAMQATLPAVLGKLREEAAAAGANAVVRVRYDVGAQKATATGVAVWLR